MKIRRTITVLLMSLAVIPLAADFDRGVALYNQHNFWDAKEEFRKVLTADKGNLPANAYLASCLYQLRKFKPILEYFPGEIRKRTINLNNPDQKKYASMLLKQIAFACMQTGQSKRAIVALSIANKLVSNDPSIYNTLGLAYLKTGKYSMAEISFQTAVHLVPSNYFYHNNLGAAYLELGAFRESLKCFERAVRINWDYANGWDNVWVAREKLGVTSNRGWKSFSYFITSGNSGGNTDQGNGDRDARLRREKEKREREARLRREKEKREREARLRREKRQRERDEKHRHDEERKRREERRKKEEARRKAELERKKREEAARKAAEERRRREAAGKTGNNGTTGSGGTTGGSGNTTGSSGTTTTPPGGNSGSGSTNR